MITLSFGYKQPETGDLGSIVFPALEGNIVQLNDHTHDGLDSAKIDTGSINPLFIDVLAAAWGVTIGNGLFKQTITLPAVLSYDTTAFTTKLLSSGHLVFANIEKVSASQYDIFTNDDSEGFKVLYL